MLARIVEALARTMAVLGGLVLSVLVMMICASILGRFLNGVLNDPPFEGTAFAAWLLGLGIGPITGDFELVEAGMAFAIFAFLPIAQLTGAHASVDIVTAGLGERVNRVLAMLWAILFAAVLVVIAWQLYQGTLSKARYGETTYLIQFPVWWAYAAALVGAAIAALVGCYVAAVRVAEFATGMAILPDEGPEH
ncbi:TRAP-type C4-dicarboxylate transport system, small permease component [Jannaschia seosinensis]|uniref:TRAP transporter small permease protein n=1 Tax=Jannaschia seosinensis TaxID=313367 RepID=A0A0M7BDX8_9RHOB|nr:TRAP transporter small permease [Jannaschia seosinensis]CUH40601.1 TRAP-type C4-dicarboxylate transport system, small permease component [Jannaschia seosinensis]